MNKKLLSLVLTFIMVCSMSTTAFATTTTVTGTATVLDTEGTTVSGSGSGVGIDKDKITKFTLPTDEALNFYYDPMGLTSIVSGESAKLSELDGGYIVMASTSAAVFINQSGFDVNVKMDIKFNNGANSVTLTDAAAFVDDRTAGATVTPALFYIQPSTANVTGTSSTYTGTEKGFVIDDQSLATGSAPTTLNFAFKAADYTITNNSATYDDFEVALIEDTAQGSAFVIGGYVNPEVSYKDADDTTLQFTFTVEEQKITETTMFANTVSHGATAYGLLGIDAVTKFALVTAAAAGAGASVEPYTFSAKTWSNTENFVITLKEPVGSIKFGVSTIKYLNASSAVKTFTFTEMGTGITVSADNKTLTLKATGCLANIKAGEEIVLNLTFSDNSTLAITIPGK